MNPFHLEADGLQQRLTLSGVLTVEHARSLHVALRDVLSPETTLSIDAQNVSQLDAAIAQVLLVAAHTVRQTELVGHSTGWTQAFQRFGLTSAAFQRKASLAHEPL